MKTSELIGAQLDWAVAKCEGATNFRYDTVATYWMTLNGKDIALSKGWAQSFTPATNWAQGGPIIEREKIELRVNVEGEGQLWMADTWNHSIEAPTPLVASMRCFVASRLGDEVEIPEELK